ncbi:MAG: hypothetical protein ACRDIV_17920 [Ktedonobacteraceae bacterium]
MTQQDLPPLAYPLFAPLPVPMVLHLLRGPSKPHPAAEQQPLTWRLLEQRVRATRQTAFVYMDPFVQGEHISSSWLMQALRANAPEKIPVGTQALSLWHERKLLRYSERGRPAPDNAAALLIARMVDKRERNWLPTNMREDEPSWWCWRQDGLDAPITACPVPLPPDLPATALLWTPWQGASWQRRPWLRVGSLGAIRWARATEVVRGSQWIWDLSLSDLEQWDPAVAALALPPRPIVSRETYRARNIEQDLLHTLAQVALYRLALADKRLEVFRRVEPLDLAPLGLDVDQPS